MEIYILFIIFCWLIFALYWIVSFFSQKQTTEKPTNSLAMLLNLFAFTLLIAQNWFSIGVIFRSLLINIIGVFVCVFGLIICIWARKTLAGNWAHGIDFKKGHELVKTGPYCLVRHPIYTGFILMFLGSALTIGKIGGLIGFFILLASSFLRIRQEEDLMIKHFKKEYLNYKKKTKYLIPWFI